MEKCIHVEDNICYKPDSAHHEMVCLYRCGDYEPDLDDMPVVLVNQKKDKRKRG